ncbi:Histidine kinase-, DNA gyrase B-, and HSP90-like ATPase [Methylomagnum ishizawai]|uniref:Histidine kinase-, DNA gyrase B-, and HSP90-like ATPase n=1 Tax=Methylomagnum ishizawai TaxID=1760988 RepID=A0A1Y6CZA7_9GAMM|nr:ATP-binding protein [Methylomagnum ishizawai]SMF93903.1 Histidine kinase-, DNA gyrase B-, and HSP90-like ATPase [Methylomagnum ishizawai]
MKKFDLNIERILENWETYHAIREIIANALDEQILTKTKDVEIFKRGNSWIIRDFGRGIKYTHLTQNENEEKLASTNVIGKFGIGLKDALATFDRREIIVSAKSKYGRITIAKSQKQGFQDIVTLHAIIEDAVDPDLVGTEIELNGVTDKDIDDAKKLFLKFSGEEIIETTKQGQIVKHSKGHGNIYINGVKVAEEENFLFSYNITTLNASIKKALNRERTNVGRTAYTDSIKKILLSSTKKEVVEILANDLTNISAGTAHDELSWIDVQEHSVKILNQEGKYLFITSFEAMQHPDMIDQARNSGHEIITIPENLKLKIQDSRDLSGNPIVDIGQFISNYNDSFTFNFIDFENLSEKEKIVYQHTQKIIDIFGGKPKKVREIKISSTMRRDLFSGVETLGCWDENSYSIVIDRKNLKTISDYAGTLIHELVHAKTGHDDVTRPFENELTNVIGYICRQLLEK